jgi:hypothetical protein
MANAIYRLSKENYSFPGILADDIKVVLTRGYVPNFTTHEFLSDIAAPNRISIGPNLGGKTFTLGVFDANNFNFTAVAAGAACNYLIIYHDTGVAGTSRLLCGLDTGFAGLPVVPDGSDIAVTWAAGGIFGL